MPVTAIEPTPSKLYRQIVQTQEATSEIIALARKHFNDDAGLAAIKRLGLHDHAESLIPGLSSKCYCLSAAAALLKFIEASQNLVFTNHSLKFQYRAIEGVMMIDPITVRNLELVYNLNDRKSQYSLYGTINRTHTSMGARLLRTSIQQPLIDQPTLETRLDAVEELVSKKEILAEAQAALTNSLDVDHLISSIIQIRTKQSLKRTEQSINNIIVLKHVLKQAQCIAGSLEPCESQLLHTVYTVLTRPEIKKLLELIGRVINDDVVFQKTAMGIRNQRCFAVRSGYHGLLDVARQTYSEATNDVYDLVSAYSEMYGISIKLIFSPSTGFQMTAYQDAMNGHTALPAEFINATKKHKKLTFTSLKLMSQNDRIKESLTEVYLMSDKIIADLTSSVREYLGLLYSISESFALVDMIASFAQYAIEYDAVRPEFTNTLAIKNGRHPILQSIIESKQTDQKYVDFRRLVANDAFADSWTRLQIITGPNMSGKSTYLRMIALLAVLAQIGGFVPAEYASVRLIDRLFSRISTDQSIQANASSFMSEMREAEYILSNITDKSLVIIDELGRGSSASDGLGICFAICEELLNSTKAIVILVTHFDEISTAFQGVSYVVNMHLHVDDAIGRPLSYSFKIKPGANVLQGYGLRLAQQVGFN
eukprot:jgi/Hompol1/702/HPOL_000441-RA